jgi:hypothetical protein
MSLKKLIPAILFALFLLFCFWFFYLRNLREKNLIEEGNLIIRRIEIYQSVNEQLPNSLSDLGITEKDESDPPLYYERRDSLHFTLSFGISMDEFKIYYSDNKQWETSYREMK